MKDISKKQERFLEMIKKFTELSREDQAYVSGLVEGLYGQQCPKQEITIC